MKSTIIFPLSLWLSLGAALATPQDQSPASPVHDRFHRHKGRHFSPNAFKERKDVVYETVYLDDCKASTTYITKYLPAATAAPANADPENSDPANGAAANGSPSAITQVLATSGTQVYAEPSKATGDGNTVAAPWYQTSLPMPVPNAIYQSSPVKHQSPKPTAACHNGAKARWCWDDKNIDTNYKQNWPNTGAVVEYWFSIENGTAAPDGFQRQVLTVNGSIPGPLITANWGDTIKVHVKNNLLNNGTSIHWHGLRQLNTNDQDGVNGITECPMAPGDSTTYEFVATTYGTSWYHSHFSAQYGDGVIGPIVIHGPASAEYDVDLGPVVIQDWFHQTIFETEWYAQHKGPTTAQNYLLNGMNAPVNSTNVLGNSTIGNSTSGNRLTFKVKKGKKYLLRLINASTDNFFKVGLDGHNFTVIANDFTPITPFVADQIPLGIGQRYDVIFEANSNIDNYWFRAVASRECCKNQNNGLGTANGIISYEGAPLALPTSQPAVYAPDCHDIPSNLLVPVVEMDVDRDGFVAASNNTLDVNAPTKAITTYAVEPVFIWALEGVAMDISWENPTLLKIQNGVTTFSVAENVIHLDTPDVWTYWVIQNKFQIAHPMHLHGHDFSLLGQGSGTFDLANDTAKLNFVNPTRRDTAMLIESGWTAIAFKTDNPGAWLLHCHIGWHVGGGLSVQFVERQADILEKFKIGPDFKEQCDRFAAYTSANPYYKKSDSGL